MNSKYFSYRTEELRVLSAFDVCVYKFRFADFDSSAVCSSDRAVALSTSCDVDIQCWAVFLRLNTHSLFRTQSTISLFLPLVSCGVRAIQF